MISGAAPSLSRRRDFDALFRHGSRTRIGSLSVVRAQVGGETKVAVIAGKAVGNSVHRSRAKRRMRAALRMVGLPVGEHIAVIASPGVLEASFGDLVRWLEQGLTPKVDARA